MKEITTKEWKEAGLPFEGWLRYAQLTGEKKEKLERKFWEWRKKQ